MERALNFDPGNVELRRRAADWYLDYEEYGSAVAHLRRVAAARPHDTDALLELGSALDLQGKDDESQDCLELALDLEPQNEAVRETLASVIHKRALKLAARGANAEALAGFTRTIELAPQQDRHHIGLGAHYLTLGRIGDAEAAFARAVALDPREPLLRVLIGMAYLDHGRAKEGDRSLREALRLGRTPYLHALIGQAYARHGQPARAEACFARVLKSRDPRALYSVGNAFLNQGRFEDAVPYLERAVGLDPLDGDSHLALAFALARGPADYDRAAFELVAAQFAAGAFGDRELLADIALARTVFAEMAETATATS